MKQSNLSFACLLASLICGPAHAAVLAADSARGAKLFETEHCVECHSVNGKGARIAPDLGRHIDRNFSPATLASTMWNHAPEMWGAMRDRNVGGLNMDDQAAADLFAYFYSARFFEKPGDAGRGKRIFIEKSCSRCHNISAGTKDIAKPVTEWSGIGDPIVLTAAMWNHAADMRGELGKQGIKSPEVTGQDLTDLLVYLRNLSQVKDFVSSFQTTSGKNGALLFRDKGCAKCHTTDASIGKHVSGETLTDVAAHLWGHGLKLPDATTRLNPGEMRELISYVWAEKFFEGGGDAGRGRKVFVNKQCATCHDSGLNGAPPLSGGSPVSGSTMVAALWHHGPQMLALMLDKKIRWPRFEGNEMADLIVYLNTKKGRK